MRTGGGPWGMAWGLKTDIWIWGGWGVLVRDWKFLYSGVGDRVGVWGQISGMSILWGGGLGDRLGMYIFSEGWFRVGGLGSDISHWGC